VLDPNRNVDQAFRQTEITTVKGQVIPGLLLREEGASPDDSLQEAAHKMKELDIGPLPVYDSEQLAGMLTDRDIVVRCIAEGRDPRSTKVREAMTEGVFYCFEDEDVQDAACLMKEKQIRRLVVLNRDRRLVGVVSLGDLAVDAGGVSKVAGKTLEAVSQPS
jgi:predicted transcriptional regulator